MAAKPLIVIVGPTASGKTALAITIARQFNGEIICADSRTVYKGMDIGTAKPTSAELATIKHWGIDIASPDERFTAADFKEYAEEKISDIRARGKQPILVGGTGLYVDAVVFDYRFGPKGEAKFRQMLEAMDLEQLYFYCNENNIDLPENKKNKRYVIRAIEQRSINNKRRREPIDNCYIVGISTDPKDLRKRITDRSEQLFESGVINEAKKLGNIYGWNHESLTGNIYPLCRQYLEGALTLDQLKEKFIVLDWRLAKRQMTWLKRNKYIKWHNLRGAEEYIRSLLETEH